MRQSKWTCPRCGAVVPYTSYQIARHQAQDLEAENTILAERAAMVEHALRQVLDCTSLDNAKLWARRTLDAADKLAPAPLAEVTQ